MVVLVQERRDPAVREMPEETGVRLAQLMEPAHLNVLGTVHGGELMKLMDTASGIAAGRHAQGRVVTAAAEVRFLRAVLAAELVTVYAHVADVGTTSIDVEVDVHAETLAEASRSRVAEASFVFVAVDDDGRPRPVGPVVVRSAQDRLRQERARRRREHRRNEAEAGPLASHGVRSA